MEHTVFVVAILNDFYSTYWLRSRRFRTNRKSPVFLTMVNRRMWKPAAMVGLDSLLVEQGGDLLVDRLLVLLRY